MYVNHIPSDIKGMTPRLSKIMIQEYGERGVYAVEMLETAKYLLELPKQPPHLATAVAGCVRQAVIDVFQAAKDNGERWDGISRQVVDANRCLGMSPPYVEKDIQRLRDTIGKLEDFHKRDTTHQTRLRTAIRNRVGREPPIGDDYLLTGYKTLISDLVKIVHPSVKKTQTALAEVRVHYEKAIDILEKIILLSIHIGEIIRLAELAEPQNTDASRLNEIMSNADDCACFASHMISPIWFEIIDGDMLKPPAENSSWIVTSIAYHLKDAHLDAFIRWINKNWDRWTMNDAGLNHLGRVGFKLGDHGFSFLVRALKKKHSLAPLCNFATLAYITAKPSNPQLVKLADCLLNPDSALDDYDKSHIILKKLVAGMDSSSTEERIYVLVDKLQSHLKSEDPRFIFLSGSIADIGRNVSNATYGMIGSLRDALQKARELGMPTPQLIELLGSLPEKTRSRFVAWLYSQADDVDCSKFIDFIVFSCCIRHPTGDDALLLDRLKRDCNMESVATQIADAIGKAPEPDELVDILQRNLGEVDRRILWGLMISLRTDLPRWERCRDILRAYGSNRGLVEQGRHAIRTSLNSESPITQKEFDSTDPYTMAARIAAWRPAAKDHFDPTSTYDIEQELEDAVKRNASKWAKNPTRIIELLQYSTYVSRYFRGLTSAEDPLDPYADQMISAIRHARAHPWPAVPLELHPFDYDSDWNNLDVTSIKLVESMIRNNVQLSKESLSGAWDLVYEVANRVVQPSTGTENHTNATGRSRTSAFRALLYLIQYVKDRNGSVPEMALAVLTRALQLTGQNGVQHRAIFAPWISFLCSAIPNWFDQNESLLFGSRAPENLGRVSLDMYLECYPEQVLRDMYPKWTHMDKFILKNYRRNVLDAVSKDVQGAIDGLVLGMLWEVDGYDQKYLAEYLTRIGPKYVSLAGECSAWILSKKNYTKYVPQGIIFWERVLDMSPKPEALDGYWMWAAVSALDQDQWERLMLRTSEMANGKLGIAEQVAERIKSSFRITDAGLRILTLLIKADTSRLTRDMVVGYAFDVLCRSKDDANLRESWALLRHSLLDCGHFQAYDCQPSKSLDHMPS